jgi:hypothetical protein
MAAEPIHQLAMDPIQNCIESMMTDFIFLTIIHQLRQSRLNIGGASFIRLTGMMPAIHSPFANLSPPSVQHTLNLDIDRDREPRKHDCRLAACNYTML